MIQPIIINEVEVNLVAKDGFVFATSLDVAKVFEKRHGDVIEKIENFSERGRRNFGMTSYIDTFNRTQKMYEMNRDGFTFLVMGFTGEKADNFKLDFIDGFNKLENELRQLQQFKLPQTFSEALRLLADETEAKEKLQLQLIEQKPKIEFYEAVTGSKDTIDMGSVAKVLNKKIGRNKLFELLREKSILMSNNVPYQKFCDSGYFRVIETKYTKPDGSTNIGLKTLVYQKGVNYINKLLER